MGTGGGIRIATLEVKFLDRRKTDRSESICQVCSRRSRTKVRGSKAIRYRPSSNHKQCLPAIRRRPSDDPAGSFRETRAFGFRGKYGCKAET